MAIYNYGIGGNEVKVDANESIAEIPSNRTLIVQKLTDEAPAAPESVYGLETIEDVFQRFEPTVDLCHVDAEGPFGEQRIRQSIHTHQHIKCTNQRGSRKSCSHTHERFLPEEHRKASDRRAS